MLNQSTLAGVTIKFNPPAVPGQPDHFILQTQDGRNSLRVSDYFIDASVSGPDHLRGALNGGFEGIANVAANRVPLAYNRAIEQWWLLIPGLAVVGVGAAVIRYGRDRVERGVAVAILGGLVASLLVNDSPGPVMLGGLAVVLAVEGGLLNRTLTVPVLRRLALPVPVTQEP